MAATEKLSMTEHNEKPPCEFCRRMRFIGILAVLILGTAITRPEFSFLRGVDLTSAAAYFFGGLFVVLLLWKAYQEYWVTTNDESSEPTD
ncbi:MAG: hypothetical protein P8P26_09670 [Porticoccaceae bacterium]|jgi:hypothetical protein|nr:hypothetical protein [Porticoccaceae bacterium]